jgi:hypothetical protein
LVDGELYRWNVDAVFLKCLGEEQSRIAVGEVHEGLCGSPQPTHKMKWALKRAGYFWPAMVEDCDRYRKRCEACQQFGNIQIAPASIMHSIVKPWPFKGWGLDFIGEIHPTSSKGHMFVLVATDYFTKWTEVVPLKNIRHKEVIDFVLDILCIGLGSLAP